MHCADRSVIAGGFNLLVENLERKFGLSGGSTRAGGKNKGAGTLFARVKIRTSLDLSNFAEGRFGRPRRTAAPRFFPGNLPT